MRARHGLGVFGAAARLGFKQACAERLSLLGNFLMYAVILLAYAGVFRWIPADVLAAHHVTVEGLIAYLGVTEFVLFCAATAHYKEMQSDILSDQIHLELLRPCPAWVVRLGDWSGQYAVRFFVLFVPCAALIFFLTEGVVPSVGAVVGMLAGLPLAGLILLGSYFMVGVSCLWLKQAEPAFWVWQKALFLLGGLLWPLALYPDLLARLVWLTPFPSVLAAPAGWMVGADVLPLVAGYLHQGFWTLVLLVLVAKTNGAMLRRIQNEGA